MKRLIQIVASASPSKVLFEANDGPITAGRIRDTAARAAARLSGAQRVYLHTASAALFVAGLLAAAQRNIAVYCPAHLQPAYLREIDADLLLTDQAVDFPGAIDLMLSNDESAATSLPDDLDLFFYTSGVTGTPKLVPKRIEQLDAEAAVLEELWPNGAQRVFATVSHQHIYGMLFRIFWPVFSGGISSDRPTEYWEQLAGKLFPDTTLVTGPAHLTRIPVAENFAVGSLIFSAGAPLPFTAAQSARDRFGSLPVEVLGSTETGGIAWRQQDSVEALWTPFPRVHTVSDCDGRLTVRSPFADSEKAVVTGDIAEHVGTQFRLKGRSDRIAKIDGKRVSLTRVEEELLAHPFVECAAATDLPGRKGALAAIVQLNAAGWQVLAEKGAFRLSRDLRHALSARLEPSERPKHWRFGTIPVDRQGKRVQSVLRALFEFVSPEVLGRGTVLNAEAEAAEIRINLAPDMIWFEGHFPGQPVLAGIAQVHIATLWSERLWGWRPSGGSLSQVKFRRILRPGDVVLLRLQRVPHRLKYSYQLDDVIASEGTIEDAE